MTKEIKEKIDKLIGLGYSANRIVKEIPISINTVKSYIRRKKIKDINKPISVSILAVPDGICLYCGSSINQNEKTKRRKFCSKKCKYLWWKEHPQYLKKKAIYRIKCKHCNKYFTSYGNKNRIYCTHSCYIKDRFKGGVDNA